MDFDISVEDDISEYQRMREKNMKEFQEMLLTFDDDINDSIDALNTYKTASIKHPRKKRKASNGDGTFTFVGALPLETRRSQRLLKVVPQYTYEDLLDDEDIRSNKRGYSHDIDNLEKVVFRKRKSFPKKSIPVVSVPVEQITQQYLKNIATRVYLKVYCPINGTSCHQCRQKTLDSKTYCRSNRCIGVRGQFCGVCLKNRYGENAEKALLDPKWECPPCRGLCNCSICRTKEGKRPTGILAPLAFQHGHKSVKDFLNSLNGVGDYVDPSTKEHSVSHSNQKKQYEENHHCLIGFNNDLNPLWILRNKTLTLSDDEGDLVGFNEDAEPVMIKI